MAKKRFSLNGAKVNFYPSDGITVSGDIIEFEDSFSDEAIDAVRKKIEKGFTKSFSFQEASKFTLKEYTPSDSDKELIKKKAKGDVDIDSFGVYTFIAAESVKDTQRDVLSKSFLEWMGEKYKEGRPLNDGHNWDYRVGKTFDYSVVPHEKVDGEYQLEVKAYVPENTKTISGNSAKVELDSGIVDRVSVSFSAPVRFLEEDHAENRWGNGSTWIYDAPPPSSNADVFELSLVTMGAQKGARIKSEKGGIEKNATFDKEEIKENNPDQMELKKYTIKALDETIEATEKSVIAIKMIDEELAEVKAKLKVFTDAEAKEKGVQVDKLVNLKVQIFGGDAEKEKAKAGKLNLDEINEEIETLSTKFKAGQLDPSRKDGKKPEGGISAWPVK